MTENISTNEALEKPKPLPVPESKWQRVFYGVVVTILPVICFLMMMSKPDWQSGRLSDYVTLFLNFEAAWIFFPLIAYSSISMLFLLFSPTKFANIFAIRLGIYTGTALSFQYSIALLFYNELPVLPIVLASWIVPLLGLVLYRSGDKNKWGFLVFICIVYIAVFALLELGPFAPLLLAGLCILPAAPFWTLLIMGSTSYRLLENHETRFALQRGLGVVAWLSGYAVAWRLAIIKVLELYAALPKEPPRNCYIATAAARGHSRVVQSHVVELEDGQRMKVTAQLQRLKCAELSLLAVAPRVHRVLRSAYDIVGKSLARGIKNPFLADLAYLSLKPFEWTVWLVLVIIAPEVKEISMRLYMPK